MQGVLNNTVYVVPGFEVHKQYELAPWAADAVAPGGKVASTEALLSGGKVRHWQPSATARQLPTLRNDEMPGRLRPPIYLAWPGLDAAGLRQRFEDGF